MGKKLKKYTGIMLAGGLLAFNTPVYAQRTVSMMPINKVYANEKVTIKGNTQLQQVTIRVKREDGKCIYIDVVKVENESFTASFRMPAMEAYGMYVVEVGEGNSFSKIEFEYAPKNDILDKPDQGGNPDQGGSPGQGGNSDQGGNPEMGGNPDQGGSPDQGGNPDQGGSPGQGGNPDQGGNSDQGDKPEQNSDADEEEQPGLGGSNSSVSNQAGSGSIEEQIKIIATDLRKTQEEKIMIGVQDAFANSYKTMYPHKNIENIEFVIEERETTPYDRAITLGLRVNEGNMNIEGKIPPIEIVVEHGLDEGKVLEYLRLTYTDQYGTHVIHGAQCDSRYLRFKAEQLGDYKVQYYQEQFKDLEDGTPEARNIHILAAQGIINGVSYDNFAPHRNITRADYLLLLMRNLNLNTNKKYENTFRDIHPNAYYYDTVQTARALGIVNGKEDNKFGPQEIITEKEIFIMTERALKVGGLLKPDEGYSYEIKNPSKMISRVEAAMIQFDVYKMQQTSSLDEDFVHYIIAERV